MTKLNYEEFDVVPQNFRDEQAKAMAMQLETRGGHEKMDRASTKDAATVMIQSGKLDDQALKGIKAKGINEYDIPTDDWPLILLNLHDGTDGHKKGITDEQAIEIQEATKRPLVYSNSPVKVDFDAQGKAYINTIDGSPFKLKSKGAQPLMTSQKLEAIKDLARTLEIPVNNQRLLQAMTSTSKPRLRKAASAPELTPTPINKPKRGMSL